MAELPTSELPTVLRPKRAALAAHHPQHGTIYASSVDHLRERLRLEYEVECTRWRITAMLNANCRRHKGGKLKNDPHQVSEWRIERLNSTISSRRQTMDWSDDQQKSDHE